MRFAVHRFAQGPPIGGQDRDGASYRYSAPYTLLPLRGISPQGETRKYVALDIVSHMTQTANPVTLLASPLGEEGHEVAKGWTVVRMIMRYSYSMSYRPLRGKRLTTFCASLALLHPLLSLTHWIFRSHSAKCVRCASLRSGGPPIGGQDRDGESYRRSTPYTLSRFAGLPLKGKRENRCHWILCHI